MGREIRRVPKDWQHPKDAKGVDIPLHGECYSKRVSRWDKENEKWSQGLRRDFDTNNFILIEDKYKKTSFIEWDGERPEQKDYMPKWTEEEKTHICMYETCSEGTPISPVMEKPEELARWLADNNASSFGAMTATYDQWLSTINRGFAVGAIFKPGKGLMSGVEGMT